VAVHKSRDSQAIESKLKQPRAPPQSFRTFVTLPTKTLAAILVEQKKDLVIAEIELPTALDIGQVLVEFYYSGICGSQLGEIDGVKGPDKWLPHLLGHEASGKVLAIGPGVKHVKPGQIVVAHWRPGKGIEANTPKYNWNGNIVNAGWITTFNQYAVISENRLTPISAQADLKSAALYGCAVTTGLGTIENKARVRFGDLVVVFGAGGIGLNLIQGALLAGAAQVVAVDLHDTRLALAQQIGATTVINSTTEDAFQAISRSLNGEAADIFIDNTGQPEVIAKGYQTIKPSGQVVLVGVPKKGAEVSVYTLDLHFGKSITGTTGGQAQPDNDIPRYMRLFESRRMSLAPLITEVAPLQKVNHLIAGMRSGQTAGRCLIDHREYEA
jgi:S-(hydroxymethyl)glutathione dehydrogenase/alcohol dehydrogenase